MTQQEPPEGYRPSTAQLRADLQHLLALFLASKPFMHRLQKEPEYVVARLPLRKIEEAEIARLMLSTAIILRVLDDREDGNLDCFSMFCGDLLKDVTQPVNPTKITLRETCNKIIHASHVTLERGSNPEPFSSLTGAAHLEGARKAGVTWRATIDIYAFVKEGLLAVHGI
jgi:hypothetical protein